MHQESKGYTCGSGAFDGIAEVFPPITAPVDDQHILRQAKTLRDWPGEYVGLPRIAAETLLLTGTEDVVIPAQNASIIARRIENSSVHRIENGGHGFFYRYPGGHGRVHPVVPGRWRRR
jgi:pimeloyl-ACP methyl ester carboxylesterase